MFAISIEPRVHILPNKEVDIELSCFLLTSTRCKTLILPSSNSNHFSVIEVCQNKPNWPIDSPFRAASSHLNSKESNKSSCVPLGMHLKFHLFVKNRKITKGTNLPSMMETASKLDSNFQSLIVNQTNC